MVRVWTKKQRDAYNRRSPASKAKQRAKTVATLRQRRLDGLALAQFPRMFRRAVNIRLANERARSFGTMYLIGSLTGQWVGTDYGAWTERQIIEHMVTILDENPDNHGG